MRIAYLLYWFPKLSETFIHDEIQWMRQMGHDVFVIASRELKETPCLHFDGCKLIADMGDKILVKYLEQLEIDHVHSHFGRFFYYRGALELVTLLDIPFTLTVHMSEIWGGGALSPKQWQTIWESPLCRAIIAITKIHKSRLEELGVPEARIVVIPCSLDLSIFYYRMNTADAARILSVGRIEPMKGHDVLIGAFKSVRKRFQEAELRIIGASEGKYGEDLSMAVSKTYGVRLLGAQTRTTILDELASATVFALPCIVTPPGSPKEGRCDGLPVAILEAMALGVPVITTSVGGITAAISDDVTGMLCSPGSICDLAEAMLHLLDNPADRLRLARNARAYIEAYHNYAINIPLLAKAMQNGPNT